MILSQQRVIHYHRFKRNQNTYQYVSTFNDNNNNNIIKQISHQTNTKPKNSKMLNINGNDAKPLQEMIQHIDKVRDELSFVKTIIWELKNDSNLNELHRREIDIGLQQINNILKSYGIIEKEPETMTLFRNQYMNNNDDKNINLVNEERQLIIHIITILGLPTSTLNVKTYSHQCQKEIYQQILRLCLIRNSKQRNLCIQQLSYEQLIDIAKRIIIIKSNESWTNQNIQTLQTALIQTIPKFYSNYKHYKKSMINQRKKFKKLTQFEKEELFIHWINIAEGRSRLDVKLFNILYYEYFEDINEIAFEIDTFNTDIQIELYNQMNSIIIHLKYI